MRDRFVPKICVSIAAESLQELERQFKRAFHLGADFVEIRFDFLKISDMATAMEMTQNIKDFAIYTLRGVEELGRFEGTIDDRILLLKSMANIRPMLVDVEFNTLRDNPGLADYFRTSHTPTLISWHNFENTPKSEDLVGILMQMKNFGQAIKIVTMALQIQDSLEILELYEHSNDLNLVAFAMGEVGILSRVLCTLYGNAPFTYASLENPVAPGQLTITQMRKLYNGIWHSCTTDAGNY